MPVFCLANVQSATKFFPPGRLNRRCGSTSGDVTVYWKLDPVDMVTTLTGSSLMSRRTGRNSCTSLSHWLWLLTHVEVLYTNGCANWVENVKTLLWTQSVLISLFLCWWFASDSMVKLMPPSVRSLPTRMRSSVSREPVQCSMVRNSMSFDPWPKSFLPE